MLRDVKTGKIKLAALSNGDKDSIFAMYVAATFGWNTACMLTTSSDAVIAKQATAMNIPLITEQSSGEEIADLYEAVKKAKEQHNITGVIVSSKYEIMNKVCKELQLRMFAPLWQKNPEVILKEMIEMGMEICVRSINSYVLGEQWLGKTMDMNAYAQLMQLHQRIGLEPENAYNSVVLYCPLLFQKKLTITKAEKVMESESKGTYVMEVAV
jgi:uncharacterized protein (TIGR00290 family)